MRNSGGSDEIYYVILRGGEGKHILANECEKMKFLETLEVLKKEAPFKVGAYCILDNQVELMLEMNGALLSSVTETLLTIYTGYINNILKKHKDMSLTVYHQEQLSGFAEVVNTGIRIHNKPVKHNIVQDVEHYWWSSYRSYKSYRSHKAYLVSPILDGEVILEGIDTDIKKAIRMFVKCHKDQQHLEEFVKEIMVTRA